MPLGGKSALWTLASAIYLLLRKDVDGKEMDEVYRDDDPRPSQPAAPIPPPSDREMVIDDSQVKDPEPLPSQFPPPAGSP